MAGGRGIEQDVIIARGNGRVRQQGREFVERGDLGGARPGQLLLDALDDRIGQHAAHRADDAVAVGLRRRLRIDLECGQPRDVRNRRDLIADRDAEDLTDVGRRVGADQQHAPSGIGELNGGRAGDGRLPDATLSGEKEEPRRPFKEGHDGPSRSAAAAAFAAAAVRNVGREHHQAGPLAKLSALWIPPGKGYFTVDQHEWQRLLA